MIKPIIIDMQGKTYGTAHGLWQYDYGQTLRIQGLDLPTAVEIHFSLLETGGESVTRVGVTRDGVTDVVIPDSMLENGYVTSDYYIYVYIYLTDEDSGETTHKIRMRVQTRPRPEAFDTPEEAELFRDAIAAVNEAADRAGVSEENAEASEQKAAEHLAATEELAQQVATNTNKVAENTAKVIDLTAQAKKYAEDAKNGVQADLNENDENSSSYVKNRTHYIQETVVWQTTNNINPDSTSTTIAVGGADVGVVVDGVCYVEENACLTFDFGDTKIILNYDDLATEDGAFNTTARVIGQYQGVDLTLKVLTNRQTSKKVLRLTFASLPTESVTFDCIYKQSNIVQLDEKYIPATIARVEDIPEAPQADWNQNDDTQPNYVKGRTHWVEVTETEVEILPECQPTYDAEEGSFALADTPVTMEGDQTITVNWNGTSYECQTYWLSIDAENDTVVFGNSEYLTYLGIEAEPNESPFAIAAAPSVSRYMFLPMDGSTELTVSIYQGCETIHKLDNKYLNLDWLPVVKQEVIIPESSVTITSENPFTEIPDSYVFLENGTEVVVYINGVYYDGIVVFDSDGKYIAEIGSKSGVTDSSIVKFDDNYIFAISDAQEKIFFASSLVGTYTVKVVHKEINKLPEKFLPESVDGIVMRSSTADSTKLFKITVDDTGTITATEVTS